MSYSDDKKLRELENKKHREHTEPHIKQALQKLRKEKKSDQHKLDRLKLQIQTEQAVEEKQKKRPEKERAETVIDAQERDEDAAKFAEKTHKREQKRKAGMKEGGEKQREMRG